MARHSFVLGARRSIALIVFAATSIVLACKSESGEKAAPSDAGLGDASMDGMAADGGLRRDSQVIQFLITFNTTMIEQATFALRRSQSDAVQAFANLMDTDHEAANQRVRSYAQQKGIAPEANEVSQTWKDAIADDEKQLERQTGASFDKAYIESQILQLVKALGIFDRVLVPVATDPALKDLVGSLRAGVDDHLQRAKQTRTLLEPSTNRPDAGSTGESHAGGGTDGGASGADGGAAGID